MIKLLLILVGGLVAVAGEKPASEASSFPANEQLTYNINWPTGLSLGETRLNTTVTKNENGAKIQTEFVLDAAIPGFHVLDRYRGVADQEFCSIQLDKSYQHGKRKAEETTKFDQDKKVATRQTKNGGKSEIPIQTCAKDALTYVQYLRRELSQGRLPPHQTVLFGAEYRVSVQYAGTESIAVSEKRMEADRLNVVLKGPATDISFQVFFSKDDARTPVMVRVPLSLATFSMELVR
jgi:hypothetical protein